MDLITVKYKENDIEQENDNEEENNENNGENNDRNKENVVTARGGTEMKEVTKKNFEENLSQITEIDGILRAIIRMKQMMSNPKEDNTIFYQERHEIPNDLLQPNKNEFPIQELIQQSYYLSAPFIQAATDSTVPYSNICVCILVDCSSFISDVNKIFNMLIICSLTAALNSLEIPYSVLLIADEKFKCVIKSFEEEHSIVALQRILDCLLIKRYRTNLIHSIKFAIDTIPESILKTRPNVSFFTFTDGLDENLLRTSLWANLLSNPNYSFGFSFIKSSKLEKENLDFIEGVWNDFETKTKELGAKSLIKVVSIQAEINSQLTKSLIEMFMNVMKRELDDTQISQYQEITLPQFAEKIPEINDLDNFKKLMHYIIPLEKGVYSGRTEVLNSLSSRFSKLKMSHYRNHSNRINASSRKIEKKELDTLIHSFIKTERNHHSSLETIFKPNKASQTVLSSTGTDFDITALILNILNPVPDPLIYLVEKGGLIRNYGVTIVIDPSISCFSELNGAHTLQTIQSLLSVFTILDLPSFDLIIAGSPTPNILCSGVNTFNALNPKSLIWESLFAFLQNNKRNVDLASSIHAAYDLKRIKSTDYSSILFVITDGLYQENEQKQILEQVNSCVQYGITTIGIGVGICPKGITNLFPQVVFSPNPSYLMNGIASIFGEDLIEKLEKISLVQNNEPNIETISDIIQNLIKNKDNPIFSSLKEDLQNITPSLDAFREFYNPEQNVKDANNEFINPEGDNTEIYDKDSLKGQKILIVMLWSNELNPEKESTEVHPDYIFKSSEEGHTECIKTAVDHFGIELKVVINYYDAIVELTKQTKPGYCDYYAVWVMCGPPYALLPPQNNPHADPNLVGQFNEVLIQYWQNGGSIVFWAEGDPLHYQVNLFLETATFPELGNKCSELRIGGEHAGSKILLGDETGELKNPQTFNRKKQDFKKFNRTSLSHNLGKIFEGITISYAQNKIEPFIPFSRDSEGGISSMFYPSDTVHGDIIIDCGYTKCFMQMRTDGTFRYVQNIAGWTARPEVHMWIDNCNKPNEWRPKAVSYNIQLGVKWNKFQQMPNIIKKRLFAIDTSGSVSGNVFYYSELQKIINNNFSPGDKIYIWNSSQPEDKTNSINLIISSKYGSGGTDSDLIADIANMAGSEYHDHLIIVTDGYVASGTVQKGDEKMRRYNIKFKKVTTYIINNSSSGADFSVGAAYSRGCPNETYYITPGRTEKMNVLLQEDINALNGMSSISTYSQFISKYDSLERAVQAKTIGTKGDSGLKYDLNAMKQRINQNGLSSNDRNNFEAKWNVLYKMADGAIQNTFSLSDIAAAKTS
ncbi:hypothetical protein GPJ56_006553 [Histomonas meleagridis]|uniref:uncharacterized protein n=1 Tax=Histomonas meleagridis TaxID=135588 RepID=UPI00355AADC9|nr:hypothetical protein GPJ56_006553 [Histomonas meleagridis]KAH0800170.1 hypothetical protein GO595_007282 [Histomonas meleagridis]